MLGDNETLSDVVEAAVRRAVELRRAEEVIGALRLAILSLAASLESPQGR